MQLIAEEVMPRVRGSSRPEIRAEAAE
jgi:hypothetical protein